MDSFGLSSRPEVAGGFLLIYDGCPAAVIDEASTETARGTKICSRVCNKAMKCARDFVASD
jgi:hypothetical protein